MDAINPLPTIASVGLWRNRLNVPASSKPSAMESGTCQFVSVGVSNNVALSWQKLNRPFNVTVGNGLRDGEGANEDVDSISLKELSKKLEDFAKVRDWEKYHTPRNLLLAMVGEVGELSEIFQWKGEVEKGLENWEESEKEHLGEELSDVLLYLIRLADICGINLAHAALNKILKNGIKYPPPPTPTPTPTPIHDSVFITKEQSSHS